MNKDKKRQKRPFLLLELLIAFSLVALFMFPLTRIPYLSLIKKNQSILDIELQLLADKTLAAVKEKLYLQEIPWSSIEKSTKSSIELDSDIVEVATLTVKRQIHRKTLLKSCLLKEGKNLEKFGKLTVEVILSSSQSPKYKQTFLQTYFIVKTSSHKAAPASS